MLLLSLVQVTPGREQGHLSLGSQKAHFRPLTRRKRTRYGSRAQTCADGFMDDVT